MSDEILEIKDWQQVESSNIDAIASQDGALYVRFTNGSVYEYKDEALEVIPRDEGEPAWNSESLGLYLAQAESVGSTFNRLIRKSNVSTRRVNDLLVVDAEGD